MSMALALLGTANTARLNALRMETQELLENDMESDTAGAPREIRKLRAQERLDTANARISLLQSELDLLSQKMAKLRKKEHVRYTDETALADARSEIDALKNELASTKKRSRAKDEKWRREKREMRREIAELNKQLEHLQARVVDQKQNLPIAKVVVPNNKEWEFI